MTERHDPPWLDEAASAAVDAWNQHAGKEDARVVPFEKLREYARETARAQVRAVLEVAHRQYEMWASKELVETKHQLADAQHLLRARGRAK